MTDKASVKTVLKDFMNTCAYVGISSGYDTQKLTQTLRRVYKTPAEVEDISILLDFTIILALTNTAYEEFEPKSKEFVEQCLEKIETHF